MGVNGNKSVVAYIIEVVITIGKLQKNKFSNNKTNESLSKSIYVSKFIIIIIDIFITVSLSIVFLIFPFMLSEEVYYKLEIENKLTGVQENDSIFFMQNIEEYSELKKDVYMVNGGIELKGNSINMHIRYSINNTYPHGVIFARNNLKIVYYNENLEILHKIDNIEKEIILNNIILTKDMPYFVVESKNLSELYISTKLNTDIEGTSYIVGYYAFIPNISTDSLISVSPVVLPAFIWDNKAKTLNDKIVINNLNEELYNEEFVCLKEINNNFLLYYSSNPIYNRLKKYLIQFSTASIFIIIIRFLLYIKVKE